MNAIRLFASMLSLLLFSAQAATPASKPELLSSAAQLRIDESSRCYSRMMSGPELGPLMGKVQLPGMHVPPERLANPSKPTAVELAAVQRWQVMLNECFVADLQAVEAAGLSRRFGPVYSRASKDEAALLSSFAGGEMTYGEFNRRISELNIDNRKRLEDAREAFRRELYDVKDGAPGYPLWEAADLVPRSREQLLLSRREQEAIAAYRRETSHVSADLFVANIAALYSNAISVSIDGKTYRIVGSGLGSKESWKWTEAVKPSSERAATVLSWTQTSSNDFSMSGQVVADGKLYEIATLGRFQVLLYRR